MYIKEIPKELNWAIRSYPGGFWKRVFSKNVIPQISKGWRLVAVDEYGPCANCYHYGNGSTEPCMNHENGVMEVFIDYATYKEISVIETPVSYHEWKLQRDAEEKKREEEMNAYLDALEERIGRIELGSF